MESAYMKAVRPFLPLLGPLVSKCLAYARHRVISLGAAGLTKQPANSMHPGKSTDAVLVADMESELTMLAELDTFGKQYGVKFLVLGEEIGWMVVGDLSSKIVLTAFMDGIDGTANYTEGDTALFDSGPMLSICLTDNPTFKQTYAAGTALIHTGWMVVGDRFTDKVVWTQLNLKNSAVDLLNFRDRDDLSNKLVPSRLLADDYAHNARIQLEMSGVEKFIRTGSTAATILLLALASYPRESRLSAMNADYPVLLLDQCDKRELEQPVLYLIMELLGGWMVDIHGKQFADRVILNTGSNANPPEVVLFTLATSWSQYVECRKLLKLPLLP